MTIILTTTEGLKTFHDIVQLDDDMSDNLYRLTDFNIRIPDVEITKDQVLLIQVTK